MAKVAISQLSGPALHYAVAHVLKLAIERSELVHFRPSTDPAQGQPLIEEHWIGTERPTLGQTVPTWRAIADYKGPQIPHRFYGPVAQYGETALIAGMRCLVARFTPGEEIEIPKELLPHDHHAA